MNGRQSSGMRGRGEVYLEFRTVGAQVRVAAIDSQTGAEVVVFGPASTPQAQLEQLAIRKLQRRLELEAGERR